jgi:ribosomal protein S18 acetylase RimI-like enzyme
MNQPVVPLERAELRSLADLYRSATPEVAEECGVVVEERGDALLVAATQLDVLALNRVVGVGLGSRPERDDLVSMVDAFTDIGSPRFFVQVAPVAGSADVEAWLSALGLQHYNNWVRLSRELIALPESSRYALSVRVIGPEDGDTFSRIVAEAFSFPPTVQSLVGCPVGRPEWRHYLAYEGREPIAAAAMFVAGESAWFGFAGTAAEWRGRGAQTALVLRRLKDAAAEGCRWVSVETAEQTPEREAPSFRNLRRLGFEVAYLRPNYLWTRRAQNELPSPSTTTQPKRAAI